MSLRFRPKRRRVRRLPHRLLSSYALAPEWVAWMADNLWSGASAPSLVAELSKRGVPRRLALAKAREILEDPGFYVARGYARSARRLSLVHELQRLHRSFAPNPGAIERRPTPGRDEFFARYLALQTPVILTDLVRAWPAFGKWTPEHFRDRYGHVEIKMTAEREADPHYDMRTPAHTRAIVMSAFVERVLEAGESNDFYLVAQNRNSALSELAPLFDDVVLPAGWFGEGRIQEASALWFGPAGTVTPLHHDTSNILFCQVFGRKRFRLVSPLEIELFDEAASLYAGVDPEDPAAAEALSRLVVSDFVLEAGEAVFIPAGYWHHVRALDVSISLAVNHFACPNHFDWYRPGEVK